MKSNRYKTSHLPEDQYEQGSRERVLKNLLGIRSQRAMDQAERKALEKAEDAFFKTYDRVHQFTAADICQMHKMWLGRIYGWAGSYREVKIGKGGLEFAFPEQIPKLMKELERGPLSRHTPCRFSSPEEVIKALAEVHVELVLIHPFREGNGRLARILATLMALQADLPPLDFRLIKGKKKQEYFAAVRAGLLDENYKPMEKVFGEVLEKTLKASST